MTGFGADKGAPTAEEGGKSKQSLLHEERTILRGNYQTELLQRRAHLTAEHTRQQQEDGEKDLAKGTAVQTRKTHALTQPTGANKSIFLQQQRQKGAVTSFLDEYLPPQEFRITPQEAKEKWKDLSDQQSGCRQGGQRKYGISLLFTALSEKCCVVGLLYFRKV